MSIIASVVRVKARVARGQGWLYYIKDIAYVFIVLYAMEDILRKFGIDDPQAFRYFYIIMPVLYFVACYYIGYLDEVYGIWKAEAVYGSKDLNPFFERLDVKISSVLKLLRRRQS